MEYGHKTCCKEYTNVCRYRHRNMMIHMQERNMIRFFAQYEKDCIDIISQLENKVTVAHVSRIHAP